jgi:hypothetical protein
MGSGFKTFTAGAVLTASDVNNYLMEQGVMYFATTAARDLAITAPEDGMVAYIGSNDVNEGLTIYQGSAWRKGPGWNAPWGYVGKTELSSNTTGITTITDLTGGALTFTAIANRLYRIEGYVFLKITGASGGSALLSIREGATDLMLAGGGYIAATGTGVHVYAVRTTTFTAGSHTIKLSASMLFGAGPIATDIAAARPDFIMVTDIGPAGAPA